MARKLRGIHTLYRGDAITEITGMCYKHRVFKYVSSPVQPAKEEIGAGVLCAFIVA